MTNTSQYYWPILVLFLTFFFYIYKQVLKKWNSKLSIWVILDLWSIKVKKIDKIALNKWTQKYWYFFLISQWKQYTLFFLYIWTSPLVN